MLKILKYGLVTLITLTLCVSIIVYSVLTLSLPKIDGVNKTSGVVGKTELSRDALGHAVINADSLQDIAYAIGVAHAQDRLFQMDTQRRAAAGKLSELIGKATINIDKNARFFQFEKWAEISFKKLPKEQQLLLERYAQGVNETVDATTTRPFEYYLLSKHFEPWKPTDSLLVLYSMYMDLQLGQVNRDLAFTRIAHHYGEEMVDFMLMPSSYQAALDGSQVKQTLQIPSLPNRQNVRNTLLEPLPDYGSNNWAVTGNLTSGNGAMVANDMHLGLRVPIIWYRAQLNYLKDGKPIQITGVSLPGIPGVVVGTNGHIAWGFTNANLDNTDWVELEYASELTKHTEIIQVSGQDSTEFDIFLHAHGPVKTIGDNRYALKWVAQTDYAANLDILNLEQAFNVQDAFALAPSFGMPVQNFTIVDKDGNAGWSPAGAVAGKVTPTNYAIDIDDVDNNWRTNEKQLPSVYNPSHGRIWTANARVISADDLPRFGDGGYAVGARGLQIRDRLFENDQFDEAKFLAIQLDNEARFLSRWHALLKTVLSNNKDKYKEALTHLDNWQACACAESIGYTLVDRFRSQVISALFAPIADTLDKEDVSFRPVIRHLEPATWSLISNEETSWLPLEFDTYGDFLESRFNAALTQLWTQAETQSDWSKLAWGEINALQVQHPLSRAVPALATFLDMPKVKGYGDSYMPAVQAPSFGASQRFFARPGQLESAVLTLPGGQSGHPLSPFYRAGFDDYATDKMTPLMPQELLHTLTIEPLSP